MAGKRNEAKVKLGSRLRESAPLRNISDFTDFQLSDIQDDSPKELDSDVEDVIYARMYFTSGSPNHSSFSSIHNQVGHTSPSGAKKEGSHSNESGETDTDESSIRLKPHSSSSKNAEHRSPNEGVLRRGKDSVAGKKKKVRKKLKDKGAQKTIESTLAGQSVTTSSGLASPDPALSTSKLGEEGGALASAERPEPTGHDRDDEDEALTRWTWTNRERGGLRAQTSPGAARSDSWPSRESSQSPELNIRMLFESSKKLERNLKFGKDEEDVYEADALRLASEGSGSSLELGELRKSGSSISPERNNVLDMEICSGAEDVEDNPWKIIEKDKLGRAVYDRLHNKDDNAGRYYGKNNSKCRNCKQSGHITNKCPWPKRHTVCYLCAGIGHVSSGCPKKICTYCYGTKHKGYSCHVPWASPNTTCTRCYMKAHHASICPDLWRQYHHTLYDHKSLLTIPGVEQRKSTDIYCSNCSAKGHFGFECCRPVPRGNAMHHLPLVAVYDTHIWPPRDNRSTSIIQHALANRLHSLDQSSDRKRTADFEALSGVGMKQTSQDESLSPPPKKKLNRGERRRTQKRVVDRNQSLTDDLESPSADEQEGKSLLITVAGRRSVQVAGDGQVYERRFEHIPWPQSLLGGYRLPPCDVDQNRLHFTPPSLSNSPFNLLNSRSHPIEIPSPRLDSPPFPRTPHEYPSQRQTPLEYTNKQQRTPQDYTNKSQHQKQTPHAFGGNQHRLSSDNVFSRGEGRNRDQDASRRSSHDHARPPPLPMMSPPSNPPLPPLPPPSRAYSSDFHQPSPRALHRHFSEPVRNYNDPSYHDASPSAERGHVRHDGQYLTSSRGFRLSDQRAREVGYGNYASERNPSYDRTYSGSGRH